jgi:hypothetical protein
VAQLIVQPAESSLRGARVVILYKIFLDSEIREALLVVGFQKKSARIAKHFGLKFPDVRERCRHSLQSEPFLAKSEFFQDDHSQNKNTQSGTK